MISREPKTKRPNKPFTPKTPKTLRENVPLAKRLAKGSGAKRAGHGEDGQQQAKRKKANTGGNEAEDYRLD